MIRRLFDVVAVFAGSLDATILCNRGIGREYGEYLGGDLEGMGVNRQGLGRGGDRIISIKSSSVGRDVPILSGVKVIKRFLEKYQQFAISLCH